MSAAKAAGTGRRWAQAVRSGGFLACLAVTYVILLLTTPELGWTAVRQSIAIALQIAVPMGIAFLLMVLLNYWVSPPQVMRFFGSSAGAKGIILSTVAGILSMGPIYAWYPLLKSLREKGAANFHLANFLCNRAVKPFLLPVLFFYFGWRYALSLGVLTVLGSLATAAIVSVVTRTGPRSPAALDTTSRDQSSGPDAKPVT